MSTPSIVKFSETQEQKEYREKCLQEDKVKIDAYNKETETPEEREYRVILNAYSKETPEEQAYREKCLQEDKVILEAWKKETQERIKRYQAYTNDPFNPIYTKEVVAGFYETKEPPKVSLFSQWPLNRLKEPQLSSSSIQPLGNAWWSGSSK